MVLVNGSGNATGGKDSEFQQESTLVADVSTGSSSAGLTNPPAKPLKKVQYKLQREGMDTWIADMKAKDPSE